MRARIVLFLATIAIAPPVLCAQDIVAMSVTGPASVGVGTTTQITATFRRSGTLTVPAGWIVAAYLSTDRTITTADYLVGAAAGPTTIATTSTAANVPLTVPVWLAPGPYYFGIRLDQNNTISEASEQNNAIASTSVVTLVGPDLTPSVVAGPPTMAASTAVTVTATVQNPGVGAALNGWVARFFLSSDATITASDTKLGDYLETSILNAGDQKSITQSLTVPADVPTATRYLGVIVDADNRLAESNETNNSLAAASTVAVTGYPDLYPVSFALLYPGSFGLGVVAGVPFDLQVTVQNRGAIAVPAGWLGQLLLSVLPPNPTTIQRAAALSSGSPVDLSVGSFTQTADIAPGATVTITKSITLPLTYFSVSPSGSTNKPLMGSYYFEVRLDHTGIVAEGLETNNNRKMTTTRSVSQPPDLVPTHVTGPATAAAGSQISVITRVVNSGSGTAAGGWRGGIYLVGSASPIMVHQYIESGAASPSAALQSTKLFFLPAAVTPGTYQLRLIVDETAVIAEVNSSGSGETNNVLDGGSVTVSP